MKQIKKIIKVVLSLFTGFIMIITCDDMNDIQKKFTDVEERIYIGKVDSVEVFPGIERVKLVWYVSADPKIDKTIIYWNMRKDSIVKEFIRTVPGIQKDSIIIESLPEGSTLVEFRNESNDGETSLFSEATATIWGPIFADGLFSRRITSQNYNYEESTFELEFSPVTAGDSVVYCQINYFTQQGEEKTVRINRETTSVILSDFPDGKELSFKTAFFLPHGIDTIFNNDQIYKSPTVVFEKGEKISLAGNLKSNYFEYNGSLYEWNPEGDLIEFSLNEDGVFHQNKVYPLLIPRSTYRVFFFYNDDKFISIKTNNAVSMHQIIDGELITVKAPSGAETFGSGFAMQKFIPAKGFFFSVKDGVVQTWFANNNATWGSPNGTTVGTEFLYDPVTLFNYKSLIGVDGNGYLYNIPITITGVLGNKSTIGSGWNKFKNMISIGDKLLCLDENGDFYQFDFNPTDYYWIIE